MTDAFIYDHVRTPRGRGKADGALHEVTTLNLATQALATLRERNRLDPGLVDDVVLGCVDPVGEAGGDIARVATICAGYGNGVPGIQINRFCASGLDAVNFAAAEVMSGQHDMAVGGGVESMSRVGIGASGGAWPVDPAIAIPSYFMPQGISADLIATKYGFSRDDVDAYAVESQKRAGVAWDEGRFAKSVVPVKDCNGITLLAKDEHMRPSTTMQALAQLQPSFVQMGQLAGFDACFFCLGVSSVGMDEARYRHLTYDITMAAATALARLNPGMVFIYVTGRGTDSTEQGRLMWARIKGKTENDLLKLPFKAAYMFRPAAIAPLHGIRSKTLWVQAAIVVLGPLLALLYKIAPGSVTTTEQVGRAMIKVARDGYPKRILESEDINRI